MLSISIIYRRLCFAALLLLPALSAAAADKPLIAVLGDSLSAGYGLAQEHGFVPQLQAELTQSGQPVTVVNAAISGDTSADGRRRVDWMLRRQPDIVIVALGANDMLRALPVEQLYINLDIIITRVQESGAKVLLAGMLATPNLGEAYAAEFAGVYQQLAQKHQVPLFPFFLKDVATVPELNLADGLHPNRLGVRKIVENIAPLAAALIDE